MQDLGYVLGSYNVKKYLAANVADMKSSVRDIYSLSSEYEPVRLLVPDAEDFYVYIFSVYEYPGLLYVLIARTETTLVAYSIDYVVNDTLVQSDLAVNVDDSVDVVVNTAIPLPYRQSNLGIYIPARSLYLLIGTYAQEDKTYLVDKDGNAVANLVAVKLKRNLAIAATV